VNVRRLIFGLAFSALAASASAQASAIVVETPEVRASLGNVPTSAAYMTVRNPGAAPDRLLGASCACAASVSLHQTTHADGIARMVEEPAVAIPAGGAVVFAPGGRHLMLIGLTAPIRAGTEVPMVLRFERAGEVSVTFTATDTPGAAGGGHAHHH